MIFLFTYEARILKEALYSFSLCSIPLLAVLSSLWGLCWWHQGHWSAVRLWQSRPHDRTPKQSFGFLVISVTKYSNKSNFKKEGFGICDPSCPWEYAGHTVSNQDRDDCWCSPCPLLFIGPEHRAVASSTCGGQALSPSVKPLQKYPQKHTHRCVS